MKHFPQVLYNQIAQKLICILIQNFANIKWTLERDSQKSCDMHCINHYSTGVHFKGKIKTSLQENQLWQYGTGQR